MNNVSLKILQERSEKLKMNYCIVNTRSNTIRQTLLLLIATVLTIPVLACKCGVMKFSEEVSTADQIFIGTVIKKTTDDMSYYLFSVLRGFKGIKTETLTVIEPMGSDCEIDFEVGKEYLVFSYAQRTSKCQRNTPATNSKEFDKLNFLLNERFSDIIPQFANSYFNQNEAKYFNLEFSSLLKDFNFEDKKVAFIHNKTIIDKTHYFKNYAGDEDWPQNLIILSKEEKLKTNGYDVIIITDRKKKLSKRYRKKILRLLK